MCCYLGFPWTAFPFAVTLCQEGLICVCEIRADAIRVRRVVVVGIAIRVDISEVRGAHDAAEPPVTAHKGTPMYLHLSAVVSYIFV